MPPFQPEKQLKSIDPNCWLCGGFTDCNAWSFKEAIGNAFTDHPLAMATNSKSICDCCAALTSKDAWVAACEKYNHSPYFPVKDDKKPFLSNWMFSSHVFSCGVWIRPDRKTARQILLSPPDGKFVITLAAIGKKHVIFRSTVNYDKTNFSAQLDENRITINRDIFNPALELFEYGYALGLSKESIVTGNYNHAMCMKIGIKEWKTFDEQISIIRCKYPAMLKVISFCAVTADN